MKTVCLLAIGSRGDIQPMLAFASALSQSKIERFNILIISHSEYKEWINQFDVIFEPLELEITELLRTPDHAKIINSGDMKEWLRVYHDEKTYLSITKDIHRIFQKHQPNWILSNQCSLFSSCVVADKLNIPTAILAFIPLHPTGEFPNLLVTTSSWFSFMNRYSYTYYKKYYVPSNMRTNIIKAHQLLELPVDQIKMRELEDYDTFYAISPSVLKKPIDWPEETVVGGYFFLDQENEKLDSRINEFLNNGKPPIYLGFGSMPVDLSSNFFELFKQLREQLSNERFFLFLPKFVDISSISSNLKDYIDSDPNIMLISSVCQRLLFPRCKCIIHHAGAGTSAAVLRSGTPSVPCGVFVDQPYWSKKLVSMGVSPQAFSFSTVNAIELSKAVIKACEEPYVSNALELSEKINEEDGSQNAVKWFLNWVNRMNNNIPNGA